MKVKTLTERHVIRAIRATTLPKRSWWEDHVNVIAWLECLGIFAFGWFVLWVAARIWER